MSRPEKRSKQTIFEGTHASFVNPLFVMMIPYAQMNLSTYRLLFPLLPVVFFRNVGVPKRRVIGNKICFTLQPLPANNGRQIIIYRKMIQTEIFILLAVLQLPAY